MRDLLNRTQAVPGFIRRPAVRIAGYYDLNAAMIVYDHGGGTFALVEHVQSSGEAAGAALRSAIDQAASFRQLLIEQADRQSRSVHAQARKIALQVELLILTDGASPDSERAMRKVLTDVIRETGYLRLIGISVMQPASGGAFTEAGLRRAFPWLLAATRKWFSREDFKMSEESWRSAGQSAEFELKDYRLAGVRRLPCDGSCNLQLVHGHNGSGKSSLAEAVELLLTNRIERLEEGGATDYFLSVRHRPAGTDDTHIQTFTPAEVNLLSHGAGTPVSGVRIEFGQRLRTGKEPANLLHSNSVRLDQLFMDKLVRSRPEARAAMFLRAFSPQDVDLLPSLRQHRTTVQSGVAALPQHVSTGAPSEESQLLNWIMREFSWLRQPAGPATAQPAATPGDGPDQAARTTALEALHPIPQDDFRLVSRLHPAWQPPDRGALADALSQIAGAATRDALAGALGRVDEALPALLQVLPERLTTLRTALRVFEEFRNWQARGQVKRGGSFKGDLDTWLENQALWDLAAKGFEIAATISAAEQQGWKPGETDAQKFPSRESPQSVSSYLETRKAELLQGKNDALARLRAWFQPESSSASPDAARPPTEVRRWLSAVEIESLNRAGPWLDSAGCPDPLGATFDRALTQDREETLSGGVIGRPGGLDSVIADVRRLISAGERLQQTSALGAPNMTARLQQLSGLVDAAQALSDLAADLPRSFFSRLAGRDKDVLTDLIAAFNELLALMTPARWLYRDIQLGPQISSNDASLDLTTYEGARADLLFNTAELNASALALFLLLAPRLPNPLRLLILDDPLQNMDELTVITVGRAIGRLMRVYPAGWQILAFFHGEESIVHIRDETQALTYELPWMQPASPAQAETIEPVQALSTWPSELQKIAEPFLIDRRPI